MTAPEFTVKVLGNIPPALDPRIQKVMDVEPGGIVILSEEQTLSNRELMRPQRDRKSQTRIVSVLVRTGTQEWIKTHEGSTMSNQNVIAYLDEFLLGRTGYFVTIVEAVR